MKGMKKVFSIAMAMVIMVLSSTYVFAAGADNRSDLQIVNDNIKAQGFKEIKSSDAKFMEKQGNWKKVVDYFKSNNKEKLDYRVKLLDGSLAILPKGADVTISSEKVSNDIIIDSTGLHPSTGSGITTNSLAAPAVTASDTYYGRGRFDKTFTAYADAGSYLITTTRAKAWYYYKCDTVHSIMFGSCWLYDYTPSPSSYTYNIMAFTGLTNGNNTMTLYKDQTGVSANLYGEVGDGPI